MNKNTKNMCVLPLKCLAKAIIALTICGLVVACGEKDNTEKTSQSIASVNGDDITFLQLNDELQRAKIKPEQQTLAEKQIVQQQEIFVLFFIQRFCCFCLFTFW